ncbi:hypothetical protein C922_05350 [Plasmodium inui San Antonio 1]|uniref:Uncharacterized protein n=1 Tax=Plasmodium inui San Antonio 1 TaxID=1237626 RepID=W6ZY73_9APIC|nr:hypothetical protein C922_05350 [Plasmodium inui San Antonio 1]EUD64263.1 hypothetical protein C922_05350 [Plasmodium inui San Antonio 1]
MKKFDTNCSRSVEFNIHCKNIVRRFFIKALAIFTKCHLSPKLKGFLFFSEISIVTVLLWIFHYNSSVATVEIWSPKENHICEWLIWKPSRLLSKEEIATKENHGYSRKNIAHLLELDEESIEEHYESLMCEGFNKNSIKWKIFGKYTPQVEKIMNKINRTIDLELIHALKSDSYNEGNDLASVKESKIERIKSFFCNHFCCFVSHFSVYINNSYFQENTKMRLHYGNEQKIKEELSWFYGVLGCHLSEGYLQKNYNPCKSLHLIQYLEYA